MRFDHERKIVYMYNELPLEEALRRIETVVDNPSQWTIKTKRPRVIKAKDYLSAGYKNLTLG